MRLRTLHGLRKWRDATFSVDLLNTKEMLLRRHGVRWLFHRLVPGRVVEGRMAIAVRNRRWRRAIIAWPALRRLLVLGRQQGSSSTMAIGRFERRQQVPRLGGRLRVLWM